MRKHRNPVTNSLLLRSPVFGFLILRLSFPFNMVFQFMNYLTRFSLGAPLNLWKYKYLKFWVVWVPLHIAIPNQDRRRRDACMEMLL